MLTACAVKFDSSCYADLHQSELRAYTQRHTTNKQDEHEKRGEDETPIPS